MGRPGGCRRKRHRRAHGDKRRVWNADQAARWPVEVERDEEEQGHQSGREQNCCEAAAEDREIEGEQPERGGCADQFENEDGARYPVVS